MIQLIQVLATGVTDDTGLPLAGGSVAFYEAGTTTLKTVFQEYELENAHSNPATLDNAGRLVAYGQDRLKLVILDSDGALVRTIDDVGISDSQLSTAEISQIAGIGLTGNSDGTVDVAMDGTSISVNSNDELEVPDGAITTAKLNDGAVTPVKMGALNYVQSGTISLSTTSTGLADVTGSTLSSLTTTGRPVRIEMQTGTTTSYYFGVSSSTDGAANGTIGLYRDGTLIALFFISGVAGGGTSVTHWVPPSTISFLDIVSAGSYVYKLKSQCTDSSTTLVLKGVLIAYET